MGGSSRGDPVVTSQQQQTDTSPWAPQQPYLLQGFQRANQLYQGNTPQYFPGQTVAGFSPQSEQALNAIQQRATTGSPLDAAAQQGTLATAQGQYLSAGNPYLTAAMQPAIREYQNAVAPGIDSAFSGAGRYGSNAHLTARSGADEALARALGGIAFQNYGQERGFQQQALGALPGMAQLDYGDPSKLLQAGQTREAQAQAQLNAEIERWNYQQNLQANKLAQYMGLVGGPYGGQQSGLMTSTQPTYYNQSAGLLGGLAGIGGLASLFL